ncbi:hypothetical protein QBC46DRAFT_269782 [Diplogelasinospora grovesii]|uniref:Rhodopsin domain-containing protein n=1 Tax=Diplogelasinospora grovesii TaxID=303347 RepID=A0AAN6N2U0_9PEZI|nr:hypothetical protein QBC46DRAFT_269782 [Diplogelasinospora grovesii]
MDVIGAYALLGSLLAISWGFFSLRLYVRAWIVRKLSWDDLLVGISMLVYSTFTGFACGIIANGLGTHIDEIDSADDLQEWSRGALFFLMSEIAFIVTSTLLRLACALMLLRILRNTTHRRWTYRAIIYATSGVMTAFSLAFVLVTLFQCQPVSHFWTYMYADIEGSCINGERLTHRYNTMSTLFMVHSIVCALSDWILGGIPFFMLKDVQLAWLKKVVLIFLLSLGVLAGVTAVVRAPLVIHKNSIEFWDAAVPVAVTTAIEPALGTIAVCSATLTPLFKKGRGVLRRLNSKDQRDAYHQHSSGSKPSGGSHRMTALKNTAGSSSRAGSDMAIGRDRIEFGGRYGEGSSRTAIAIERSWIIEESDENERDTSSKGSGMDGQRQHGDDALAV